MSKDKQQSGDPSKDQRIRKSAPKKSGASLKDSIKRHFAKSLPVLAVGFVSGVAELVGLHAWEIGTAIADHPFPSTGVGGVAIVGAAVTRPGRAGIRSTLRWLISIVSGR